MSLKVTQIAQNTGIQHVYIQVSYCSNLANMFTTIEYSVCLQQVATLIFSEPKDNQIYLRVFSLLLGFPAFEFGTKSSTGMRRGAPALVSSPDPSLEKREKNQVLSDISCHMGRGLRRN